MNSAAETKTRPESSLFQRAVTSRNLKKFRGFFSPGLLIAVGYMDPGNWATDIEGGARFGALIFVIFSCFILSFF